MLSSPWVTALLPPTPAGSAADAFYFLLAAFFIKMVNLNKKAGQTDCRNDSLH